MFTVLAGMVYSFRKCNSLITDKIMELDSSNSVKESTKITIKAVATVSLFPDEIVQALTKK